LIQCPSNGGWSLCTQNARVTCQGGSYDVLEQSTDNGQNGLLIACKTQIASAKSDHHPCNTLQDRRTDVESRL